MKKFFFLSAIILMSSMSASALIDDDDDMYFTPSKAAKQAQKEAYERQLQEEREQFHREMQRRYEAIMRHKRQMMIQDSIADAHSAYSSDSIASDVIEFTTGSGEYPDSTEVRE